MIKSATVTLLTACLFFPQGPASADRNAEKQFYGDCISHKIEKCLSKTRMIQSKSICRRRYGEINLQKAAYYHRQRTRLINTMLTRDLETKPYKVEYYLIRAFGKEMNKTASPAK